MSGLADVLPAESVSETGSVTLGGGTRVEAVARPANESEVAAAVRWAGREGITALPLGTGRHVHRVVAPPRAAVLQTGRLRGVRIYEPADLTLTAGAGTGLAELRETLAPHGQWLPFDPPDAEGRTLGGLVASGLSGPLATGYGALRNHVLGATVVSGDGTVVKLGGRVVKNVAGFDLLRPLVGSMGGLGVLTEICVRLFPVPQAEMALVARADHPSALVGPARAVARASVLPASTVLVANSDGPESGAALVVRIHGASSSVRADGATFEGAMGRPVEVLDGEKLADTLRIFRDHPTAGASEGLAVVAALPDRLGNVLSALDSALGSVSFSCDVFAGTVRFAFGAHQLPAIATVRRAVDVLGGSLGVERLPREASPDLGDQVSDLRPGEAALAQRVRAVYDPPGVFWRSRRSPGPGAGASVVAPGSGLVEGRS